MPRSFLKPSENFLVVFDEEGGNPEKIEILTVNRDTICSLIQEDHPPHVKSWERKDSELKPIVEDAKPGAHLRCSNFKKMTAIEFASFGDPTGSCGRFQRGKCNSTLVQQVVEKECLGKSACDVPIDREVLSKGSDDCPDLLKTLAIQAKCS